MSDLTTYTKIKNFLGVTSSGDNSTFALLAKNVSYAIESYCNRHFTEQSYTEYFDTKLGDTKIFLRNFPVASLTSVKYQTGTWGALTWTDFNSSDYLLRDTNGKLSFASTLPEAEKFVQVIYTGGYKIDFDNESNSALHNLPGDIEQVATEWAGKIYNNRKNAGILSESTEGQSVTFKTDKIPEEYLSRLATYRNLNI